MSLRLLGVLPAILLLGAPVTLPAKEKKPAASPMVEFSCVVLGEIPLSELFYRRGQEYLPIKLSSGQRSQPCTIQEAYTLEILRRSEKAAGKEKSNSFADYELVGLAPLLKGAKRILFLIEPTKESDLEANGLPLQLRGMDDSLEVFPRGAFRFVNLTPDPLRVEMSGATMALPRGAQKVVVPELPKAGEFLPVVIKNEAGRHLFENRLFAQPTEREMVLIIPSADGRADLTVKFLSDPDLATQPSGKQAPSRK